MRRVTNRAKKSDVPQANAVAKPSKIPIRLMSFCALRRGQAQPSLFASLSRLHLWRRDCGAGTRDDTWPSACGREIPAIRRGNARCRDLSAERSARQCCQDTRSLSARLYLFGAKEMANIP